MNHSLLDSYKVLYNIPIETLDLSEKALRLLKWHGLLTIGECVRFYIQDAHHLAGASRRLTPFMYGEVEPKMKASGYWDFVMNPEIWRHLQPYYFPFTGKVVTWQGQNLNIDNVTIAELGFSEGDTTILWNMQVRSLGLGINHIILYIHACHRTPFVFGTVPLTMGRVYRPEEITMFEVLEERLRALGYWRFVEENLDER